MELETEWMQPWMRLVVAGPLATRFPADALGIPAHSAVPLHYDCDSWFHISSNRIATVPTFDSFVQSAIFSSD